MRSSRSTATTSATRWSRRSRAPSTLGRFQYDFEGRRTKKIGEEGLRQYVYDQTSLLAEYDDASSLVAKYDYGSDRLISLFRRDEPRRYFSLDGLRTVVNLTDDTGSIAASYHLDAWGNYRNPAELDASKNRFGFTGHEFDKETGLYNAKARYFDPQLGRFLTQDSFLGQIDAPPSLHRYFYANANPTRFIDPTGHAPEEGKQTPSWVHWAVGAIDGMDEFQKRLDKLPEQAAQQTVNLLTPGHSQNKGVVAQKQRDLLAVARDPKKPVVARVEAAGEALKMQPAVVVEETVVRPAMEAPGHAKAAGQHLAQAETAKSPVEKAVHYLEATKETAQAFTGFATPAALVTGGGARTAATAPEAEFAPRVVRVGQETADTVASGSPPQLVAGRAWEEAELAALGKARNTDVWRPTTADMDSAAFKVIVGPPKFTATGKPVGTAVDIAETSGSIELKGGSKPLESSYQLRLQTYRALTTDTPLVLRTTRSPNPTFADWLQRWGVTVERPPSGGTTP